MLKFFAGSFAIAGLIAAAGPILIHLLNRRRFRVVDWAAMDFLRQAMQRSRRAVQLRDLLVLVLRCLAVVIFGAALARPFISGGSSLTILAGVGTAAAIAAAVGTAAAGILTSTPRTRGLSFLACAVFVGLGIVGLASMLRADDEGSFGVLTSRQPVHAVLLVDNSMSMACESLEGSLLDRAKTKAAEFIDALPSGSRIHVTPLCVTDDAYATSAYRNKSDARAALDRIKVVDRPARIGFAMEQATEACRQVPEIPSKRVVLLSDQQESLWAGGASADQLADLPDLQIMRIAPEVLENVWVSDLELQDGVADTETPAVFHATVHCAGEQPLGNVPVQLLIDGNEVASRLIDLEPGQARRVEFRQVLSDVTDTGSLGAGLASATFVNATVRAEVEAGIGDRLTRDNARHIVVPVVAGLPVVFVDQYGQTEDIDRGEIGETYRLRRLLAPRTSTDEERNQQLIEVRHLAIDRLTEENLTDARLVVVAGVESPGDSVELLREYVEQGGNLIIAAGADFDLGEWASLAWLDGAGILPAPLSGEPVGQLPEVAVGQLEPFYLDFRFLQHEFFLIEGETEEALKDLYRLPLFFKAIAVETGAGIFDAIVEAEVERIRSVREELASLEELEESAEGFEADATGDTGDSTLDDATSDELSPDDSTPSTPLKQHAALEEKRRELQPRWLSWADPDEFAQLLEQTPEELAERSRPQVLARYTLEERPFLMERRVGAGRTFLITTGLFSSWNTLTSTNAIIMFDRMMRQLLEDTLPRRNFDTGDIVTLPARQSDQIQWELIEADGTHSPLVVEALSADRYGLRIRRAVNNGHYRVTASPVDTASTTNIPADTESETRLAFNCPPEESQLEGLDALAFEERAGNEGYRWLEADQAISVEGARIRGRGLWKWLITAVLLFLLAEMTVLAWPHRRSSEAEIA